MELNTLGVFKDFWDENHPHHLPLMNLEDRGMVKNEDWNLEISLDRIEKVFKANRRERLIEDMGLLINEPNWRPQLLFCISLFKLKKEEQLYFLKDLWIKLEENSSWIIPQLAVTASMIDSDFNSKAREILKKRTLIENLNELDSEKLLIELSRGNFKYDDKSSIALDWKKRLVGIIEEGGIKR